MSEHMSILLALDLSLNRTGYAVAVTRINCGKLEIIETGVITPNKSNTTPLKLRHIADELLKIREKFSIDIDTVIIENGFYKFVGVSEVLWKVRGVAELVFCNYPIIHYTPTQTKKFMTGNGKASKQDMVDAVNKRIYPKMVTDDNEADALGLIFCYLDYLGKKK